MQDEIITIYVVYDDYLKAANYRDDSQAVMTTADDDSRPGSSALLQELHRAMPGVAAVHKNEIHPQYPLHYRVLHYQ